ncbi:MAG: transglutaminase domain-containing protein [Elusimicrobia bacterium]|nr:transglutaminase domain-containing protein [Elusimicrobiota bacterium]
MKGPRPMLFAGLAATALASLALGLKAWPGSSRDSSKPPSVRSLELIETVRLDVPPGRRSAALWIPRPANDSFQTAELLEVASPWPPQAMADPDFGNALLYFEADSPSPGAVDIRLRYRITRKEQGREDTREESVSPLFREPRGMIVIDSEVRRRGREAVRGLKDPLEKARALYRHVLSRMSYDTSGRGWGRGDVVYACKVGKGNCTDFHSLFIALALSQGIPARFQMGFPLPEEAQGAVLKPYHCWAEFHVAGRGWLPVDISEAWKHPATADYYFGRLDANRVLVSTGREIRLPRRNGPPLNFMVRPYAEEDGKPFYGIEFKRRYRDIRGGERL